MMTTQEALQAIGLQGSPNLEEIEAAYKDQFSRIQVQLDHSPNATLKKTFEENLVRVNQAYAILSGTTNALYPSTKPGTKSTPDPTQSAQEGPGHGSRSKNSTNNPSNKWMIRSLAIAILSIAAMIYFLTQYVYFKKQAAQLQIEAGLLKSKANLLTNGKLILENAGNLPWQIYAFETFYYDESSGGIKKEKREFKQEETLILQPGGKSKIDDIRIVDGDKLQYNGEVIIYILYMFIGNSSDSTVYSGMISDPEKSITLNLDAWR